MSRRAVSEPPDIAGYTYLDLLGMGGYADVFAYEQLMPRRKVAVKVMIDHAAGEVERQRFTDEANAMASVSDHPHIVAIHAASVAADGRPYLVMELYDGDNYSKRSRESQIPLAEVLRVGVQISAAVEAAHRAGILHRDIKPANILTNRYGKPALTDFGIAGSSLDETLSDVIGMSIPWSPPEVVMGREPGGVPGDVYSLAATVYTLLVGRSPFEPAGKRLSSTDLMARIDREPPPPLGRADVPPALARMLAQALAKSPGDRPQTAAAFGRQLQEIEVGLGFQPTPLDLYDPEGGELRAIVPTKDHNGEPDPDSTRLNVRVIEPEPESMTSPAADGVILDVPAGSVDATSPAVRFTSPSRGVPPAADDGELTRAVAASGSSSPAPAVGTKRRGRLMALAAVGVIASILLVAALVGGGTDGTDESPKSPTTIEGGSPDIVVVSPPAAVTITAVAPVGGGVVEVSWTAPTSEEGSRYRVRWRSSVGTDWTAAGDVEGATARIEGVPAGVTPCVEVMTIRANGQANDDPPVKCADTAAT